MSRVAPLSLVPDDGQPRNQLLALLPHEELGHIRPHLRTVPLAPRQILHKQGERLWQVYFPNGGVVSMATVLADGGMVEAASIGDEGLVGVEASLSADASSACETIVQVPVANDSADVLTVDHFRRALADCRTFREAVARYTQVLYAVMARLTACNARHHVQERCARWLLMTHDRVHGRDFHLSQEFLAVMLGVRRPTVSVVAGVLRASGFITYSQGNIQVVDRQGLEAASCECYAAIRSLFGSLQRLKRRHCQLPYREPCNSLIVSAAAQYFATPSWGVALSDKRETITCRDRRHVKRPRPLRIVRRGRDRRPQEPLLLAMSPVVPTSCFSPGAASTDTTLTTGYRPNAN